MSGIVSHNPGLTVIFLLTCIIVSGAVIIGAIFLGRSIKVDVMGVHAELKPNGGNSFRDIFDKRCDAIELRLDAIEKGDR